MTSDPQTAGADDNLSGRSRAVRRAVIGLALITGFGTSATMAAEPAGQPAGPVAQGSAQQSGAGVTPGGSQPRYGQSAGEARLADLFYQLQTLQQEVQELRGLVEEQAYQIERLGRDQQEQYIDLDRRVAELRGGGATGGGSVANPVAPVPPPAPGASEREAYTNAFNLMKNRQFDASAEAFNKLINDFPEGQFTPNAYYWLGELSLAKAEHEKARQAFMQVVNLYPDNQKMPDALYKLGVVYHRLGDTQRSLEYLGRVRSEYPQSSAAGLAATYAAELR